MSQDKRLNPTAIRDVLNAIKFLQTKKSTYWLSAIDLLYNTSVNTLFSVEVRGLLIEIHFTGCADWRCKGGTSNSHFYFCVGEKVFTKNLSNYEDEYI